MILSSRYGLSCLNGHHSDLAVVEVRCIFVYFSFLYMSIPPRSKICERNYSFSAIQIQIQNSKEERKMFRMHSQFIIVTLQVFLVFIFNVI